MSCFFVKQPIECAICGENYDESRPREKFHASKKSAIHEACRKCAANLYRVSNTHQASNAIKPCPFCRIAIDPRQFSEALRKTINWIPKAIVLYEEVDCYQFADQATREFYEDDAQMAKYNKELLELRGSGGLFTCFAINRIERKRQELMNKPVPKVVLN